MLAAPMVCKGFRSFGSKLEEPSTPEPPPTAPYQAAAAAATRFLFCDPATSISVCFAAVSRSYVFLLPKAGLINKSLFKSPLARGTAGHLNSSLQTQTVQTGLCKPLLIPLRRDSSQNQASCCWTSPSGPARTGGNSRHRNPVQTSCRVCSPSAFRSRAWRLQQHL